MRSVTRPSDSFRHFLRRKYAPLGRTIGRRLWLARPEAVRFLGDCKAQGVFVPKMWDGVMDGDVVTGVRRVEFPVDEWTGRPDWVERQVPEMLGLLDRMAGKRKVWVAFELMGRRRTG